MTPDLDAARACADDADIECSFSEAERVFRTHPDDPTVHFFLASAASQVLLDGDPRLPMVPRLSESSTPIEDVARQFLPGGLAFAESPARAEILQIIWWHASYAARVERTRDGDDLIAERAALKDRIENLRAVDDLDEVWRLILLLALSRADNENPADVPPVLVDALSATGDPVVMFMLAKALPFGSDAQREIFARLLESDPAQPRFSAYLLYDAAISRTAASDLRDLSDSGGMPDPRYDDDLLELTVAQAHADGHLKTPAAIANSEDVQALAGMLRTGKRRDTTEAAATLLAQIYEDADLRGQAWSWLDLYEQRFGESHHDFGPLRAKILEDDHSPGLAARALLDSLKRGGTDYNRWLYAASYLQDTGENDEAVRLYQYYLLQVDARANGLSPFGPAVDGKGLVIAHARVWGRFVELEPIFFARASLKAILSALALTAAGILAATRLARARAYAVPGAVVAEVVFFTGLLGLRLAARDESIAITSWLWLFSATARTFVLVAGGLYVSATVSIPRRPRVALWVAGALVLAAIGAGLLVGEPAGPRYLLDDMPAVARLGELGLAPRIMREAPAVLLGVLREDASAFLVWPALAMGALGLSGARGQPASLRTVLLLAGAVASSAIFAAAGSALPFFAACAGAAAAISMRLRFGAIVPFVLHLSFALGQILSSTVHS